MSTPTPRLMAGLLVLLLGFALAGSDRVPELQASGLDPYRPATVERLAWAMGTELRVRVHHAERAQAVAAAERVIREVERLDALLGTWAAESPLSRARDAGAGEPVALPSELISLLDEAERWASATERAFDPNVGALVDAWDLRGDGHIPTQAELTRALEAAGAGAARIDPTAGTLTWAREGSWIDTGAFGKGGALRHAARELRASGVRDALVDLGGQLLLLGDARPTSDPESAPTEDAASGTGWRIGIAHPAERTTSIGTLRVSDASVATSGASERWIEVDGERFGHILDPRTGRPAPAWGGVTVVAADALVADVLATALFVLGPDAALEWARDRPDIGVLVAIRDEPQPDVRWNRGMETWLDSMDIDTSTQGR